MARFLFYLGASETGRSSQDQSKMQVELDAS